MPTAAVTPFALLVPIAGLGSAALILGEQLTLIEVAAGLVILLGLAIALELLQPAERPLSLLAEDFVARLTKHARAERAKK